MRLVIACVGRMRAGPEKALTGEYLKRLPWKVSFKEIDGKDHSNATLQKQREAVLLLDAAEGCERMVALDEKGKTLGSREFATRLGRWRQEGIASAAFVIGGSHGLDDAIRQRADLVLSLGRMTWPHMLARVLLAEQLYRAHTILTGHPYHRD